jgi:DNA (cytosine-5)-methyltransferase 1
VNYYNENEPYCVQWLKNLIEAKLIPAGHVDDRDIRLVQAADLAGYHQCHFFAGIAGWSLALGMAGFTGECWTGSCPCQPFSAAGKRKGFADKRHLWPEWFRLIRERRPPVVFGEQVARAGVWLDAVLSDLEGQGYACGAAVLPAASVGAPHRRDRFWFVADTYFLERRIGDEQSTRKFTQHDQTSRNGELVADAGCARGNSIRTTSRPDQSEALIFNQRRSKNMADAMSKGFSLSGQESIGAHGRETGRSATSIGWWSVEPDVGRVAHGVLARVAKLRALGNAIVPQVAAEFIRAYSEVPLASRHE